MLASRIPELRDFDRVSYLYKAKGEDEDVPAFWRRALEVFFCQRHSFRIADIVEAFTVSFTQHGDFGQVLQSTSVEPTTFETALLKILASSTGEAESASPRATTSATAAAMGTGEIYTRDSFTPLGNANSGPDGDAAEAGIWASLVNALSPTKAGAAANAASDGSHTDNHTVYVSGSALNRLQALVCAFSQSAEYRKAHARHAGASSATACIAVVYADTTATGTSAGAESTPPTRGSSASSRWSFRLVLDLLLAREREKARGVLYSGSSSVQAQEQKETLALLEGLLHAGDAPILLRHMRRTGALLGSTANAEVVKIMPGPKSVANKNPQQSSPGLLSFFGSSSSSSSDGYGETSDEDLFPDCEVASLELCTQIAAFEASLAAIELEISSREQLARTCAEKSKKCSAGSNAASERFKTQALSHLRRKRDLQKRFDVVHTALGHIEEVQSKLTDTVVHVEVLEAMTMGTKILQEINRGADTLVDQVDDVLASFEDLKMETADVGAALSVGSALEDSDLEAELEALEVPEKQPAPAAAARRSGAAVVAPIAAASFSPVPVLPAAPSGVVDIAPPQSQPQAQGAGSGNPRKLMESL